MSAPANALREDVLIGRREFYRSPIGLTARVVSGSWNFKVEVHDLSIDGARLKLFRPSEWPTCLLSWLGFEAYAEVIWREDLLCGVQFRPQIDEQCVVRTAEFCALMEDDCSDKYRRLAAAWVHGPGDW